MEKKQYIPPFIEEIKPFERTPLLSKGSGQLDITDEFVDGEGDGKGFSFEDDDSQDGTTNPFNYNGVSMWE